MFEFFPELCNEASSSVNFLSAEHLNWLRGKFTMLEIKVA
jgi:hypothetical protein